MDKPQRLHWGCGGNTPAGWINSDIAAGPGVDICCDILKGIPLEDESVECISSQHGLPELGIWDQVPALRELHRVLKPGGVLRMSLPDLDLFIDAYRSGRADAFHVHAWDTPAGNFITHMLWHSTIKTPFTYAFAEELMKKAGFREVYRTGYRQTNTAIAEIVDLDNREAESFYIEAVK
jgi:predicted SAM-dependent methyltransferase